MSCCTDVLRIERELVARRVTEARASDPRACCIAMHDPSLRRGLWCLAGTDPDPRFIDSRAETVTLLAGREGDDATVTLSVGQTLDARTFADLISVLSYARWGAQALHDEHEAREWSRWVPATERLPGPDVDVLVTQVLGGHHVVREATYRVTDPDEPGAWWAGEWDIHNVVAWQPLPDAWGGP